MQTSSVGVCVSLLTYAECCECRMPMRGCCVVFSQGCDSPPYCGHHHDMSSSREQIRYLLCPIASAHPPKRGT
eukprot:scaffold19097_cov95-Isochrysis_galbana.AAC.4